MSDAIALNNRLIEKNYGHVSFCVINTIKNCLNYFIENNNHQVKYHDDKPWIYKPLSYIADKANVSERHVQRIVNRLKEEGILDSNKLNPHRNINYYTLNIDYMRGEGLLKETSSNSPRQNNLHPKKPTNTTTQDMINIWNATFPLNREILTKQLGSYLYQAYKTSFDLQISNWESYCHYLLSKYPNGYSLDNALKFSSIREYTNRNIPSKGTFQEKTIHSEHQNSSIDETKINEMISIWNTVFKGKSEVTLRDDLKNLLSESLKNSFKDDLDEWKCYCRTLSSSSYIMSEEFKLHLKWAIKTETLVKVKNKELGIKEIIVPFQKSQKIAEQHINEMSSQEDPILTQARKLFVQYYGAENYVSWLPQVKLIIENNKLVIDTPNLFVKDWIQNKFQKLFYFVEDLLKEQSPPKNTDDSSAEDNETIDSQEIRNHIREMLHEHSSHNQIDDYIPYSGFQEEILPKMNKKLSIFHSIKSASRKYKFTLKTKIDTLEEDNEANHLKNGSMTTTECPSGGGGDPDIRSKSNIYIYNTKSKINNNLIQTKTQWFNKLKTIFLESKSTSHKLLFKNSLDIEKLILTGCFYRPLPKIDSSICLRVSQYHPKKYFVLSKIFDNMIITKKFQMYR